MKIVCKQCGHDHGLKEEGIEQAQARAGEAPRCFCGCEDYKPEEKQ